MAATYKGIILAGGMGTRLRPSTTSISKQLLPIYDKPMIFYPISVLMLSGIRDIMVISTPRDLQQYKDLLGNGSAFGVNFSYAIQEKPNGLAESFIIGEKFIKDDNVSLILGDNFFYGQNFSSFLTDATKDSDGATIFGYQVLNPKDFGVVEFDSKKNVLSIEEKPKKPKSNFAVTGLYFYDNDVVDIAKSIVPSERGELEITALNNVYLSNNKLKVSLFGRGFTWLDTGTHESLLEASQYVHVIEKRQGFKIACLEEIALQQKWINETTFIESISYYGESDYGQYLKNILEKNS